MSVRESINGRGSAGMPVAVQALLDNGSDFWYVAELRHCELADKEHEASRRQYAHTFHQREKLFSSSVRAYAEVDIICVADAFWRLPKEIRDGLIIHEIGHIMAGPEASEAEANVEVERKTGGRVAYTDSRYGPDLERAVGPVLPKVQKDSSGRVWAGLRVRI